MWHSAWHNSLSLMGRLGHTGLGGDSTRNGKLARAGIYHGHHGQHSIVPVGILGHKDCRGYVQVGYGKIAPWLNRPHGRSIVLRV